MIPARFYQPLFGLVLSGMMSALVSLISTLRSAGLTDGLLSLWLSNWLASWLIAFPAVLVVAPFARRLVLALTAEPGPSAAHHAHDGPTEEGSRQR